MAELISWLAVPMGNHSHVAEATNVFGRIALAESITAKTDG